MTSKNKRLSQSGTGSCREHMSLRLYALSALNKSRRAQLGVRIRAALSSCQHTLRLTSQNNKPCSLWVWDLVNQKKELSPHSPCVSALLMLSWCVHIRAHSVSPLSQHDTTLWGGHRCLKIIYAADALMCSLAYFLMTLSDTKHKGVNIETYTRRIP